VQTVEHTPNLPRSSDAHRTTRELFRLIAVAAVLVAVAGTTYVLPSEVRLFGTEIELSRVKPWLAGEPVPVVHLFAGATDQEVPAFAGAGGSYRPPAQVEEGLAASLGTTVARNLGEDEWVAPDPAPQGSSTAALGQGAEGDEGDDAAPPAVHIDPREYADIDVEIENAAALGAFFGALEATARERTGAVTRVAHYGDSSIATDLITHTVRRRLQQRFGDAGHGFVLVARGTMPYGHRDVSHRATSGWDLRQLVMNQDRTGLYGFGGVAFRPLAGAFAAFGTDDRGPVGGRVSAFHLYFRRRPNAGSVNVRIDGGEPRSIDTSGEEGDDVEVLEVPDGPHTLELRAAGGGPIRLYGVALERDGPGVVYDSLGMVGARARRLLNYDPAHIADQMRLRDPDLLVLGFGGNEADDPIGRMPRYADEFREVIRRMRAGREDMACLVFAPLDQARRDPRGAIRTIETVPLIVEAQRTAARAEGCAFFDTFAAMGGEGSMFAWSRARPRLALTDYRHATPAGYEVIGNVFYKALLKAFADHLR
jgi:lysophospholipase L1-like esterase